MIESGVFIN